MSWIDDDGSVPRNAPRELKMAYWQGHDVCWSCETYQALGWSEKCYWCGEPVAHRHRTSEEQFQARIAGLEPILAAARLSASQVATTNFHAQAFARAHAQAIRERRI